jgi:hypothetical protein
MSSGPLQRSIGDVASAHPEVEFALVLARTIDSASADPEQLRGAIYELARQKLSQLSDGDPSEKARLMRALEVAIAGVESHSKNNHVLSFPTPSVAAYIPPPRSKKFSPSHVMDAIEGAGAADRDEADQHVRRQLRRKEWAWSSSAAFRYFVLLIVFAAIAAALVAQRRGVDLASLRSAIAHAWSASEPRQVAATIANQKPEPVAAVEPEPKRDPLLPTAYGVYAVSGGRLYDLQMLQGRAPDPRVAVSAAITKPSETILPDGHVRFIVFRRDAPGAASDVVEVRVIARVKQAMAFAAGKPVVAAGGDTWVIRNVAIPFRAAPLKDDPQMYEVRAREADSELSAGRYALVVRGQAFDFTVEGKIIDKAQCLERLAAANGVFYSECQNP